MPTTAAKTEASTGASTSASNGGSAHVVVPIPTVRAPAAKNAPWPSDACPAYPMSSDNPVTTIAASTSCMKNVTSDISIGIARATPASTAIDERVSRVDVRRVTSVALIWPPQ